MTPMEYAQRYLGVQVDGPDGQPVRVEIRRYHRGGPTPAKDKLLSATSGEFARHAADKSYRLELTVNGVIERFVNWQDVGYFLAAPFSGKGSPEACQIVIQLALRFGGVTRNAIQAWADANLGTDCNGFVGNFLMSQIEKKPWRRVPVTTDVGPSTTIDYYWNRWVDTPVEDLDKIDASKLHLIVRVDDRGNPIPQYSASGVAGHVAITNAGEIMHNSYVSNSLGGIDLQTAKLGMYGKTGVRTVESGGPVNGVGPNWMIFVSPTKLKGVYKVNRDRIHFADTIRIGTLRAKPREPKEKAPWQK